MLYVSLKVIYSSSLSVDISYVRLGEFAAVLRISRAHRHNRLLYRSRAALFLYDRFKHIAN